MGKTRQKGRGAANTSISTLVCTQCGARMYVPRNIGQQRGEMHKKHMLCFHCKKTTEHLEIREFDTPMSTGFYIRHSVPTAIKDVKMENTAIFTDESEKPAIYIYVTSTRKAHISMIYNVYDGTIVKDAGFTRQEMKDIIADIKNNEQYILEDARGLQIA